MTETRYFLDSSAWLAYFLAQGKKVKSIIEENTLLFTSCLSLFEVKRKLTKNKETEEKIERVLSFIKEKSIIVDINESICENASIISLPAVDSLIYESAKKNNCILVTGDNDFRSFENVIFLK